MVNVYVHDLVLEVANPIIDFFLNCIIVNKIHVQMLTGF